VIPTLTCLSLEPLTSTGLQSAATQCRPVLQPPASPPGMSYRPEARGAARWRSVESHLPDPKGPP
jgi:hypothetical protein